ncbi:MAG: hypothetical protein NT062_08480, partial [Proteobacteria bacterium]|nr:hypothetical protein [Pseudomonadota bacterium]
MLVGEPNPTRRLPFTFHAAGTVGRLVLADVRVGGLEGIASGLLIERLELEVGELGTDSGQTGAERFQRRRTHLRSLALQANGDTLDDRVNAVRRQLAGLGIHQV